MNLKNYLDTLPVGGKRAFAKKLGIAPAYLYQMSVGIRSIPVELCIKLTKIDSRMTLADLRPELWSPEILGYAITATGTAKKSRRAA